MSLYDEAHDVLRAGIRVRLERADLAAAEAMAAYRAAVRAFEAVCDAAGNYCAAVDAAHAVVRELSAAESVALDARHAVRDEMAATYEERSVIIPPAPEVVA